jgi:hypothetical protein
LRFHKLENLRGVKYSKKCHGYHEKARSILQTIMGPLEQPKKEEEDNAGNICRLEFFSRAIML